MSISAHRDQKFIWEMNLSKLLTDQIMTVRLSRHNRRSSVVSSDKDCAYRFGRWKTKYSKTRGPLGHKCSHVYNFSLSWKRGSQQTHFLSLQELLISGVCWFGSVIMVSCWDFWWTADPSPGFSTLISSCKWSFLATDWEQWVGCGFVNVMCWGCLEMVCPPHSSASQ